MGHLFHGYVKLPEGIFTQSPSTGFSMEVHGGGSGKTMLYHVVFHFSLVGFKLEETKLPCVFGEYTSTKLLSFSADKISLVQWLWMAWRSQCGWFSCLAAGFPWSFLSYSHWSTRSCNLILVEHILVLSCIVFKPKLHNSQMNSEIDPVAYICFAPNNQAVCHLAVQDIVQGHN